MKKGRIRKGKRRPEPPKRPRKDPNPHWTRGQKILSGAFAAAVAILGSASAVVAFFPRVIVEMGDPLDSANPYSSPITVSNGVIPLDHVGLKVGLCELKPAPNVTLRGHMDCSAPSTSFIALTTWQNHRLAMDDKWRVVFSEMFDSASPGQFAGGDVTLVVTYVPQPFWLIQLGTWFERAKQFRFQASNAPDGKWRWFPKTIDRP